MRKKIQSNTPKLPLCFRRCLKSSGQIVTDGCEPDKFFVCAGIVQCASAMNNSICTECTPNDQNLTTGWVLRIIRILGREVMAHIRPLKKHKGAVHILRNTGWGGDHPDLLAPSGALIAIPTYY